MSLTASIVLADVAAVNHTFDLTKQLGTESTRIDLVTTLAAPTTMLIRHSTTKKGLIVIDRHVVSFRKTTIDGTSLLSSDGLVSVSFEVPRSGATTVAHVQDLWAFARNFLPSAAPAANFNSLLIGQS